MTAIDAPEPAGGTTPPNGGAPDADHTELPIRTTSMADADNAVDAGIAAPATDPALDIAERLLALQCGNPAQRDLAGFILRAIDAAENTEINPFEDDEDADENADGESQVNEDAEPVPADVLAYRAGVAGVDACESLASALQATRARITTHAHAYSRAALRHGDVSPGQVIQHADGALDRVMTSTQILSIDLATVLHAPTGLVSSHITEATQLVHHMPKTLARLESGELTAYHWRLISTHLHRLSPEQADVLDEVVSGRSFRGTGSYIGLGEDRATTTAVKRRLDRALDQIGHEPASKAKRKSGFVSRYVGFGPVGEDGMANLYGLVPAIHARAIDTLLSDLAKTAPDDDERTLEQRRADVFMTLFSGPAALAPPLQTELDLSAPSFDDDGHCTVVDPAQNLYAYEVWETIRLLAATLGLTFPDVPRAVINLDITTETLDRAHHLAKTGSPPGEAVRPDRPAGPEQTGPAQPSRCRCGPTTAEHPEPNGSARRNPGPTGAVCPEPPESGSGGDVRPESSEAGSAGEVCPDSSHDRRPPRSGAETAQDANLSSTSGTGADVDGTHPDNVHGTNPGSSTAPNAPGVSEAEMAQAADASTTNGSGADAVPHIANGADISSIADAAAGDDDESGRLRAATVRGIGDVPDQLALRLLRHADLRRVITDPITGQPLEAGRRRPNSALRNAVLNRDRTCRFPACDRVPLSMELDHITPYDDTKPAAGQTVPQNLECLCRFHHRAKHQLQWTPVMNDDNSITWRNNLLQIIATT